MDRNSTTDEMRELLKANGLRYSRPREAILAFFGEKDTHISAEGLYLELKQRGEDISLSTVYLNLNVLATAGMVREFTGLAGEALYDSNVSAHYHLICKGCGRIIDVFPEPLGGTTPGRYLKHIAEKLSGWQVDEPELNLHGYCPACRGKSSQD